MAPDSYQARSGGAIVAGQIPARAIQARELNEIGDQLRGGGWPIPAYGGNRPPARPRASRFGATHRLSFLATHTGSGNRDSEGAPTPRRARPASGIARLHAERAHWYKVGRGGRG